MKQSLWDLKLWLFKLSQLCRQHHEAIPMGFETQAIFCILFDVCRSWSNPYGIWNYKATKEFVDFYKNHEAIPMGFETFFPYIGTASGLSSWSNPYGIWNIVVAGLWYAFKYIMKQSLWDLKLKREHFNSLTNEDHEAIPMGFETYKLSIDLGN